MTTPLRILLLTHIFNGLSQRLFIELRAAGHAVSIEFDIADTVAEEAVAMYQPDLVIAPFLKRRIPESIWSKYVCLVVHPGPPGDGGPSALDWAILRGAPRWGVTVLQANGGLDAGEVWAFETFAMRGGASKSSLYRREVTGAAVRAVQAALQRFVRGAAGPRGALALPEERGAWQPLMRKHERAIDWTRHDQAEVLRRAHSGDGSPGAEALVFGQPCRLFDLHEARITHQAAPGTVLAWRGPALAIAARGGGAVWVGHMRRVAEDGVVDDLKLPATEAFAEFCASVPASPAPLLREVDGPPAQALEWDELRYREYGSDGARVGWLEFDFHNGAMSERQCRRLEAALIELRVRPLQVLVLAGGAEFFCNGIHLHTIEAASRREGDSAADASWRNIQAIDDTVLALLETTDRLTVAALRGNAGAGGCFLALAADEVWAQPGVVMNPHYKNMGNLYGSEYWTYTLPRRIGLEAARAVMRERLPTGARQAAASGLIDDCFGEDVASFETEALERALALAASPDLAGRIAAKAGRRALDEAAKPLAAYREEELARMRLNFYGFDPSYHVARHHFVHRKPQAWTPRHLAIHR